MLLERLIRLKQDRPKLRWNSRLWMRASSPSGLVQFRFLASDRFVRFNWCSKQICVGAHVDFATLSVRAFCSRLIERQVLLARQDETRATEVMQLPSQ